MLRSLTDKDNEKELKYNIADQLNIVGWNISFALNSRLSLRNNGKLLNGSFVGTSASKGSLLQSLDSSNLKTKEKNEKIVNNALTKFGEWVNTLGGINVSENDIKQLDLNMYERKVEEYGKEKFGEMKELDLFSKLVTKLPRRVKLDCLQELKDIFKKWCELDGSWVTEQLKTQLMDEGNFKTFLLIYF